MKTLLLGAAALALFGGVAVAADNTLTPEEKAQGWTLLFDGKTTTGWRNFRKPDLAPAWKVVDGALTVTGPGGDIVTVGAYDNFELRIEWKISKGGNSGIFYHVVETGPAAWTNAPEYQLLDNANASEPPTEQAASLFELYAPSENVVRPTGEFNETRLVVDHGRIEHWLNGRKVLEYRLDSADFAQRVAGSKFSPTGDIGCLVAKFGKAGKGPIALQDHGDEVAFRNIKIRPLG